MKNQKEVKKVKSFDELPQLITTEEWVKNYIKNEIRKESMKYPQTEEQAKKVHLRDKKFSCPCKDCQENDRLMTDIQPQFELFPSNQSIEYKSRNRSQWYSRSHQYLKSDVFWRVKPDSMKRTSWDDQVEKTIHAFWNYYNAPEDEKNHTVAVYWIEYRLYNLMGKKNLPLGKVRNWNLNRVLEDPDQPKSSQPVRGYWGDTVSYWWQSTMERITNDILGWIQGKALQVMENYEEKFLPAYLECEDPFDIFEGYSEFVIDEMKEEYYRMESSVSIEDSYRSLGEDQFFENWDLDFDPVKYEEKAKKSSIEWRSKSYGGESDYIKSECRAMAANAQIVDYEWIAFKRARTIIENKLRALRKYPNIWKQMEIRDVNDPLWTLFLFIDTDDFYILFKEIGGKCGFPSKEDMRQTLIYWSFMKIRGHQVIPKLRRDELKEYKKRMGKQIERTRELISALEAVGISFLETNTKEDLGREDYNESLKRSGDPNRRVKSPPKYAGKIKSPSVFENYKWLSPYIKQSIYSDRALGRALNIDRETARKRIKEYQERKTGFYDSLPKRESELMRILHPWVLYKILLKERAEVVREILAPIATELYGRFEVVDEAEEEKKAKKIEKFLKFWGI